MKDVKADRYYTRKSWEDLSVCHRAAGIDARVNYTLGCLVDIRRNVLAVIFLNSAKEHLGAAKSKENRWKLPLSAGNGPCCLSFGPRVA